MSSYSCCSYIPGTDLLCVGYSYLLYQVRVIIRIRITTLYTGTQPWRFYLLIITGTAAVPGTIPGESIYTRSCCPCTAVHTPASHYTIHHTGTAVRAAHSCHTTYLNSPQEYTLTRQYSLLQYTRYNINFMLAFCDNNINIVIMLAFW